MGETKVEDHQQEVDEKGVPLSNRLKEMERKLQEKYDKELAETRKELEELKTSRTQAEPEPDETDAAKAELMEFVRSPKEFMRSAWRQEEFQREIPQATDWIKSQNGYTSEDDARVFQIIKENKLDTPYHTPMERARTAWRLLSAEKREKQAATEDDERKREESAAKSSTEGTGKATPKTSPITRNDLIRKLAEAEAKGDLDMSIKLTGMLEDVR